MERRNFIKTAGAVAAGVSLAGNLAYANSTKTVTNKLPKWKGFNLLDYFSPAVRSNYAATTEDDFKWMADWGFDFVRFPMAYPRYLK